MRKADRTRIYYLIEATKHLQVINWEFPEYQDEVANLRLKSSVVRSRLGYLEAGLPNNTLEEEEKIKTAFFHKFVSTYQSLTTDVVFSLKPFDYWWSFRWIESGGDLVDITSSASVAQLLTLATTGNFRVDFWLEDFIKMKSGPPPTRGGSHWIHAHMFQYYLTHPRTRFMKLVNKNSELLPLTVDKVWQGGYAPRWGEEELLLEFKLVFLLFVQSQLENEPVLLEHVLGKPPYSFKVFDQWWEVQRLMFG